MLGLRCFLTMTVSIVAGCSRDGSGSRDVAARPSDSVTVSPTVQPPATHIDSILPIEEEIRRFRAKVQETPTHLRGGAPSRDQLVRRWVRAVETRDSLALRDMLLNAAEYITLYYPESPYTHPPYRQSPGVRWALITNTSMQGASRVWKRHAGLPHGLHRLSLRSRSQRSLGRNKVWTGCVVEWKNGSDRGAVRLFGPIIERDGEFKFLTYASDY